MADAKSYTLADYALNSNDPLVQRISYSLIMNGMALQDVPMQNYQSLKANGVRFQGDNLPTVGWRNLNEDPATTKGTPTPFEEQAYTMSNNIDIDSKLLRDVNSIQDPFAQQLNAYLKAASYDFNDKFINNNHKSGDQKAFDGLRERLDNTAYRNETEMKIDCGGVDLSQSGMTAATANNFLEYLDQALSYMGDVDGNNVVIYGNDLMSRRIPRAIRLLGAGAGFDMTQDAFGRRVSMFRNARIVDIGRKQDQSTRIITNTETAAGANGSSTMTSLYFVKYGMEDAFKGWQFDTLESSIIGPFLLQNGVQQRLTIDWTVGLFQENTRAIARLYDIKVS